MKSGPVSETAAIHQIGGDGQEPGDDRRPPRDGSVLRGTSGAQAGLSGDEREALGVGWLLGMAIVVMIITINILTRHHDRPEESFLVPLIYEGSSALVLAPVLAIPAAVALWLTRGRRGLLAMALAHPLALVLFSMLHVGGFVLLRKAMFGALNEPYRFGPVGIEYPYEFGKDAFAYLMSVAGNWWMLRLCRRRATAVIGAAPSRASFDIQDGGRLLRAPLEDILAVRSAGNYAEFLLADGRRPLMRTSLAGLETRLAPCGFVRTHRSWLVNAARVTGLRPAGSGDYAVELGAVEAPLSRRFPQALATLRS